MLCRTGCFCLSQSEERQRSFQAFHLARIVINAALVRLRRVRPELLTSIDRPADPGEEPWLNRVRDPGPNPEELFGQQERRQTLEQNLQALPPGTGKRCGSATFKGRATGKGRRLWDCR